MPTHRSLLVACLVVPAVSAAAPLASSNVSVDPFGPFFGLFDGAYSYAASAHVAITGAASYISTGSQTYGWGFSQVTASAPLYLHHAFSGPFAEPGVIYRAFHHQSVDSGSNYSYDESWVGPELLLGWHWTSDIGVNVALAAGIALHAAGTHRTAMGMDSSIEHDPDFNGYFRIGYNF